MKESKSELAFIIPPPLDSGRTVERVFGCNYGLYPIPNIFFLGVVALIRESGFGVEFLDAASEMMPQEQFSGYISKTDATVFCLYTVNLAKESDIKTAKDILAARPGSFVVFMGPSPTDTPDDYLVDPRIFVARGEPEYPVLELARNLLRSGKPLSEIQSLSRLENGVPAHNPPRDIIEDLDTLPFPARDLLKRDLYYSPKLQKLPFTVVNTSRGCPFRCRYCVPNSLSFARELENKRLRGDDTKKPQVKFRSAANVIAELEELKREGYSSIAFLDDIFILKKERSLEIIDAVGRLGFQWSCLSRADFIDEDVAAALARADCSFVDIGIESFNQPILDDINKDLKVEQAVAAMQMLKKNKVRVKLNILLGASELETAETIEENMRVIFRNEPDSVMFGICNPFPGTRFWDIAREKGWLIYDEYRPLDVQRESSISYPHMPAEELQRHVRSCNKRFFFRPSFIMRNVMAADSFTGLLNSVKSAAKKLF